MNGYIPSEIITEIKNLKLNSIYSRKWSTDAILSILRNPVYKRFQTYNKRGVKRNPNRNSEDKFIYADHNEDWDIVSQDIWDKVKQIRLQREASTTIHSTNFLLRDILKCKHCNTVLETKNNGNVTGNLYFCPNKFCKKIKPLNANILHNSFFKLLDIDIAVLINSNKNKYNELFDNYINKTSFINKILSFNNFILDLDDSPHSKRLFRMLLLDTFDSLYINENLEITIVLK